MGRCLVCHSVPFEVCFGHIACILPVPVHSVIDSYLSVSHGLIPVTFTLFEGEETF